jgi:hypothetical protein
MPLPPSAVGLREDTVALQVDDLLAAIVLIGEFARMLHLCCHQQKSSSVLRRFHLLRGVSGRDELGAVVAAGE